MATKRKTTTKKKTTSKKASGIKSYQKSVFGSLQVKAAKRRITDAERKYKALVKAAKAKYKNSK